MAEQDKKIQVNLRLPTNLYDELREKAKQLGISYNAYMIFIILRHLEEQSGRAPARIDPQSDGEYTPPVD